jgi:hypothetical protein
MTVTLPNISRDLTEEQIERLSVNECLALRQELQRELARFHQINPGVMTRFINRINERLFKVNYDNGIELNEAHEG